MKGISFFIIFLIFSCSTSTVPRETRLLNESLRQCYVESDSYSGKEKQVLGKMTVNLILDSEGRTKECKIVTSDFKKDPNLHACVSGIYKKSIIANPEKKFEMTQTINFQPVNQ
jgi:hypothetical protein